ncbi:WcaI family glycosyltransferase [Rhizobium sp. S-51]|uniref:WcaI family glycosyltransferase n=1 Tax=Rhizobium terricola TaxID=2728849 RepID=A0A7Y0AX14_9HYPH|nr:WcaI family glycosyltransferase [Rhizobium terricola]NML75006.1 WcaI family glycosyltransferase [Rhizobium terricola]
MNEARKTVVIYGMNYAPEMAGVGRYTGEIAEHLASLGMDVTVVTTPPHYPDWRVSAGFSNRYSSQHEARLRILRCPLVLSRKMGGVRRLVAPLTFALTSAPVIVWQVIRRRPDVLFCVEPTLCTAPVALLAARIAGTRTVLHVQDLEVDAAFAVGHLWDRGWLKTIAFSFEKLVLPRFDKVVTISDRMAEKLLAKGVDNRRLSVVRNWVDLENIFPLEEPGDLRRSLGFADEDFVVLYAGTVGAKHGLRTLLMAAEALVDEPRVHFVIAGEGPLKAELEAQFGQLGNLRFLPFQPASRLNELLNMADLHVLPQERGVADLALPSKLGGMLASGKPILVNAEPGTELADFLGHEAVLVAPGDLKAMVGEIRRSAGRRQVEPSDGRLRRARLLSRPGALARIADLICWVGVLGVFA